VPLTLVTPITTAKVRALLTAFAGRPLLRSGLRQLLFGLAAAGITFAIGSLIDTAIG
jgi:hypothetical protein